MTAGNRARHCADVIGASGYLSRAFDLTERRGSVQRLGAGHPERDWEAASLNA